MSQYSGLQFLKKLCFLESTTSNNSYTKNLTKCHFIYMPFPLNNPVLYLTSSAMPNSTRKKERGI